MSTLELDPIEAGPVFNFEPALSDAQRRVCAQHNDALFGGPSHPRTYLTPGLGEGMGAPGGTMTRRSGGAGDGTITELAVGATAGRGAETAADCGAETPGAERLAAAV